MPVLLLAHGDPEAKALLRQAIEARYGVQPPALESLRIDFKGRARAEAGPIATWVPVDATAYFQFPNGMRWDFTVKPMGVAVRRGSEAFDGETYRTMRGGGTPDVITNPELVSSLRRRLWGIAAFLLTPLGEMFVKLSTAGNNSFVATNTKLNDAVTVYLRANNTIDYVEVDCVNPDNEKQQKFYLRVSEEQTPVNELMLPKKISTFWDNDAFYEVEPVGVEVNPQISDETFRLEKD